MYVLKICTIYILWGDIEALLTGQQTCDSQVAGLGPGWAPLCSGLGQATYICVHVTKQYKLVPTKEVISLAGKVNADLVESTRFKTKSPAG